MRRQRLAAAGIVLVIGTLWLVLVYPPAGLRPGAGSTPETPLAAAPQRSQPTPETFAKTPAVEAPETPQASPDPASAPEDEVVVGHPMALENLRPPPPSGPLRERKLKFASESRGPAAPELEDALGAALHDPDIPRELVRAVQCRRTLCRVDAAWTNRRAIAYVSLYGALLRHEAHGELAVDPTATTDADGERIIQLFVQPAAAPALAR